MVQSIISASLIEKTRIRQLDQHRYSGGSILYWMSRDQRVKDNWALLFAYEMAKKFETPLFVIFNLVLEFLGTTLRQYDFMVRGLQEVTVNPEHLHIPLRLSNGYVEILWSIGGLHDRPWFERPVFGKVRYTSNGGLHRKFNPDHYIARVQQADYS